MLNLKTVASIEAAALEPLVRSLIAQHLERLSEFDFDLTELGRFIVIEPGDTLREIETELGFSLLASFENPRALPYIESVRRDHDWFELLYLDGDGFGTVLILPCRPDVDQSLLARCSKWASQST